MASDTPAPGGAAHQSAGFWKLTLGSIGVVYGDIGTSPLYALREALHGASRDGLLLAEEVIGIVSLLIWTLVMIVTVKYVLLILRADNRGEGGTLALLALVQGAVGRRTPLLFGLGIAGAALFYGDAAITPAISVLSAIEGLTLVQPAFEPFVIPITLAIIVALFWMQSGGTDRVSALFGPVTLVWLLTLAALGAGHAFDRPAIFHALNPYHCIRFFLEHGFGAFAVMGSVFLAVTGAEALYADMGHFGRGPIRFAWTTLVFPALTLNYLGQGSLVLARPEAAGNSFFLMAPAWGLLPLVLLATAATVIASQAVITGAYSLTQQAVQLGLLPRFEIRHTSESLVGQIYMPRVNWLLLAAVLALVLLFGSSASLASAYGIAVTGTMIVTSLLAYATFRRVWGWPATAAAAVVAPLLAVELVFFVANLLKFFSGGYLPLALALALGLAMATWVRGTAIVLGKARSASASLSSLIASLSRSKSITRVPGTAVFLTADPDIAPSSLLHNLKHNHVLHAHNLMVTVSVANTPRVPDAERLTIEYLSEDFTRITVEYGFMEEPNVPRALALARKQGVAFDIMTTSFFLSRRNFKASPDAGMPLWQDKLFIALSKSGVDATSFYRLPSNRVVELGQQMIV
ncbi:potassium transporter Kup [Amaricoccus sp.]|uniref:potassium transporter Kup n=1 Tax=Amaricoccus sp. TaxID=1872485 RepID=UPI001B705E0B|nr:potassium transporter Kup [Amaricoccus sp.]MBP7003692.1 potassium transporter Kup [Amaricoccus sp.]